jgi:predicted RND superfamily exporter protein
MFVAASLVTALAVSRLPDLELTTDLLELLPDQEPASHDYRLLLQHFRALDKVYVLVESSEPADAAIDGLADAACSLATILEESDWFSSARCGLTDRDEDFLVEDVLPRAALLLPAERLDRLARRVTPEVIRERVALMKARLEGPFGVVEAPFLAADPLGIADELPAISSAEGALAIDPVYGIFLSRSRRQALVIATPSFAELDTARGQAMAAFLADVFRRLETRAGGSIRLEAVGGPLYAVQDEKAIRGDLIRTVNGAAIAITILLLFYFRGIRVPLVLLISVLAGITWTAALMTVLRGGISVISVSFASILIGLGVDYGIHGSSAFQETVSASAGPGRSMIRVFRTTGPAIVASAATTAAAFLVLVLADFWPVRELGLLVASGILLVLTTSVLIGASLLVLLPGRTSRAGGDPEDPIRNRIRVGVDATFEFVSRRRLGVIVVAACLTLVALWGATRVEFDASPRLLRPADHAAARLERMLVEEFALGLDGFTVVVQGTSTEDALTQAGTAAAILRGELPSSTTVLSPADYLVEGTLLARRIEQARRVIGDEVPGLLRDELSRQGFRLDAFSTSLAVVDGIAAGKPLPTVDPSDWPDWLNELIGTDEDGVFAAVQVRGPTGAWPDGPPQAVTGALKARVPGVAVASISLVGNELRRLVGEELRYLSGWCLLVTCGVVLLSFRFDVRRAALSLVPVTVSCVWVLGICGFSGIAINLFSVTAAPLLLGIGIDDGLHALHGARSYGSLRKSLTSVAPAIVVTTLSTCLGFGSLTLSQLPALRSGGLVIALGTGLCLVVTLVLLPAVSSPRKE